jgi:hypothetical protein
MKPANYAPVYCALYPQLAEVSRTHGYALAIHGSLGRDMDLICIPWGDVPSDPQTVVDEITSKFAVKEVGGPPTEKPHGRTAYTLSLAFGECAIDLSFMPHSRPYCHSCGGFVKHHEGGVCLPCHVEATGETE